MPQLTFNKEQCPKRITATLEWDQLTDKWMARVHCSSQTEASQASFSREIPSDFTLIELCMAIEVLFEDWIQLTPAYAVAQFGKSLAALHPSEVPAGLQVVSQ